MSKPTFKDLENYIARLPKYGIPACDIAVHKDHDCVFRSMAGYSDYEKTRPITADDLYYIFSNTKLVTLVAAMQLIEQGRLALTDEVSRYLPAYKNTVYRCGDTLKPTTTPMTVYHLLTMTSGLNYDSTPYLDRFCEESETVSTRTVMEALAKEPLSFNPGERWKYGRSLDVLGAIIEVISDLSFGAYIKQNIFEPLGMKHSTFRHDDPYVKAHISAFYSYNGGEKTAAPLDISKAAGVLFGTYLEVESGGAGLISCTDDYGLLVDALANGGVGKSGARILKSETIEEIKKPRLDLLKQSQFLISHFKIGYSYGYGVRTLIDKGFGAHSPIGEFAWDGMTGGYGLVDTDNRLAVCYMQNVHGCNYAWNTVFPQTRDMIYEILGLNT